MEEQREEGGHAARKTTASPARSMQGRRARARCLGARRRRRMPVGGAVDGELLGLHSAVFIAFASFMPARLSHAIYIHQSSSSGDLLPAYGRVRHLQRQCSAMADAAREVLDAAERLLEDSNLHDVTFVCGRDGGERTSREGPHTRPLKAAGRGGPKRCVRRRRRRCERRQCGAHGTAAAPCARPLSSSPHTHANTNRPRHEQPRVPGGALRVLPPALLGGVARGCAAGVVLLLCCMHRAVLLLLPLPPWPPLFARIPAKTTTPCAHRQQRPNRR